MLSFFQVNTPTGKQPAPWDDYRLRCWRAWIAFVGYIPGVCMLGYPLTLVFRSEVPLYIIAAAWMILIVILANFTESFRCPRCQQPFFRRKWFHNGLARRCLNCGLPKWADVDGGG